MGLDGRRAPVLVAYPFSTGAQVFLFASDGEDGYATWAAGPEASRMSVVGGLFLPAPHKAATRAAGPAFTCVAVSFTSGPARGRRSTISPAFFVLSPGPNVPGPPGLTPR